jgi:hypothetical protein
MATGKLTSPSTVDRIRRFTLILRSIIDIGVKNYPAWNCLGECSVKTSQLQGLQKMGSTWANQFQIGSAVVTVRQPRLPCYKLAAKFQRDDMLERFLHSGLSGFYFSVEQEGDVSVDDSFEVISREPDGIAIAEMNQLFAHDRYNRALIEKAIATPALPDDWKEYFGKRLSPPAAHASS